MAQNFHFFCITVTLKVLCMIYVIQIVVKNCPINPNRCRIFGLLIMQGGGWNPPYEKQLIAEATIFNLHQQSACHMKGVMFSVHLIP